MTSAVISLENVTKTYCLYEKPLHRIKEAFHPLRKKYHTPFNALQAINLEINDGESVGLIGRNGSGKSTLLQLICNILPPSIGNISVKGRISALLELGAGFNLEFTGRENVYLNSAILGISQEEVDAKFVEIANFADIGDFIDRPVKTYSSGMYIRLAFATAISVDPEILIVDEALSVGDIFFQQKCMYHMQKLMKEKTIVLVSHDMHSVVNLCDRVVVLDKGKIIFNGSPVEGVSEYTRILHDEQFGVHRKNIQNYSNKFPLKIDQKLQQFGFDISDWCDIKVDVTSGVRDAIILKASVTCNDHPVNVVKAGDRIVVRMLVSASYDMEELIFGYTVKDRIGNALFGENSLCLDIVNLSLKSGYSLVEFSFLWPEVYPYKYTITLGIGQGAMALGHVIQCWAHDVVALTAVAPGRSIHGMFNNVLEKIDVTPL